MNNKTLNKIFAKVSETFSRFKITVTKPKHKWVKEIAQKDGKHFVEQLKNYDPNQFIENLFSEKFRPVVHATFTLSLFVSIAYAIGKISAVMITPQIKIAKIPTSTIDANIAWEKSIQQIENIKTVNLFNVKSDENSGPIKAPVKSKSNLPCFEADAPTNLNIKLVSTTVLQDTKKSIVTLQKGSESKLLHLRELEKIEDFIEIGKISTKKVIFKNLEMQSCEFISIEDKNASKVPIKILDEKTGKKLMEAKIQKNPNITVEGNKFTIKKKFRDEVLKDLNNILTQARAIQIMNPDGTMSFRMTEIVPGSIYSQLNIKDGDIISGFDGKPIKSLNELMLYMGKIKELDNINMTVSRDGIEERLEYQFE